MLGKDSINCSIVLILPVGLVFPQKVSRLQTMEHIAARYLCFTDRVLLAHSHDHSLHIMHNYFGVVRSE